jgi:hypothetical protein
MRDPDRWTVDRPGSDETLNSVTGFPVPQAFSPPGWPGLVGALTRSYRFVSLPGLRQAGVCPPMI